LGAGLSGLTVARALKAAGESVFVLEACPSIGGLTRTVRVDSFCFDYTGHLLHLSRYGRPSEIPLAGQRDEDWQQIERRSYCHVGGRLARAPIQYHLGDLPDHLLEACRRSYDERSAWAVSGDLTFRDFVVREFGRELSDLFLIPQNEKTQAISLERLTTAAMKRFFPPPDDAKTRAGMERGARETVGAGTYNSKFWYPRMGGIELLIHGLARGLEGDISLLDGALALDIHNRVVHSASGRKWPWSRLYSSIPLRDLCLRSNDPDLQEWGGRLTHSSTVAFNLGIRGDLPAEISDAHWIYTPDRGISFYRVGFYSNLSRGMCPSGHAAAYVEIGAPSETVTRLNIQEDLYPRALRELEALGWIRSRDVVCAVSQLIPCAYVHHTPAREAIIGDILSRLGSYGIYPIGRYGTWDYTSMEDSIQSAIDAVERTR
jgi:protoporphyrinogen oxidase